MSVPFFVMRRRGLGLIRRNQASICARYERPNRQTGTIPLITESAVRGGRHESAILRCTSGRSVGHHTCAFRAPSPHLFLQLAASDMRVLRSISPLRPDLHFGTSLTPAQSLRFPLDRPLRVQAIAQGILLARPPTPLGSRQAVQRRLRAHPRIRILVCPARNRLAHHPAILPSPHPNISGTARRDPRMERVPRVPRGAAREWGGGQASGKGRMGTC